MDRLCEELLSIYIEVYVGNNRQGFRGTNPNPKSTPHDKKVMPSNSLPGAPKTAGFASFP